MEAAQSARCVSAVTSTRAVIAVSAKRRIPEEYKPQSFFGHLDLWDYRSHFDEKLCEKCEENMLKDVYRGSELQGKFPYLEIKDVNTIEVNEHPNCRCELWRITYITRYFEALEKIEKREAEKND